MTDRAYILFWDTSLVGDEGVTAELIPFPGSDEIIGWKELTPSDVPQRIYFEANAATVRRVDYPDNNVNWPVMSERMRSLLLPNAPRYRLIPVTFLDDTVPTDKRFHGDQPRSDVAIEGFAAVQLLERTDAMDMERSRYTPHERIPGRVKQIKELVFKSIPLPSLFRLTSYPHSLLISAEARASLEKANIKGAEYLPLTQLGFA